MQKVSDWNRRETEKSRETKWWGAQQRRTGETRIGPRSNFKKNAYGSQPMILTQNKADEKLICFRWCHGHISASLKKRQGTNKIQCPHVTLYNFYGQRYTQKWIKNKNEKRKKCERAFQNNKTKRFLRRNVPTHSRYINYINRSTISRECFIDENNVRMSFVSSVVYLINDHGNISFCVTQYCSKQINLKIKKNSEKDSFTTHSHLTRSLFFLFYFVCEASGAASLDSRI